MKFLHAMIRVSDKEKSLKFYRDVFGLNLVNEMRLPDCDLYFLADEGGQTQIELTVNDETPKEGYDLGSGFGHFAFEVKSMDDFVQELKENGIELTYGPEKLENYDMTIAFLQDPDGYEIELIENN